ncbi:hypothetical protein HYX15_01890 [Candidatus Woesearchaeota archaeon]|nr:hypothetical protein [Candidatus Woesearchaeota archaeon]
MDKKSFAVGLIFLIYGLISLMSIESLEYLFTQTIEESMILFGGIFLLFTLSKSSANVKLMTIISSLILIFLGLFPLLIRFRIMEFSFLPIIDISRNFLEVVIIVFGIYSIIDSFYLN